MNDEAATALHTIRAEELSISRSSALISGGRPLIAEQSDHPVPYPAALARMERIVRKIRAEDEPEHLWLLEHPSLFTAGTSAKETDLFNPRGYPTYPAGRGGQWTYHGPGQRIGYVMMDLTRSHGATPPRDLRAYIRLLEAWIMATLARFGVKGERREDRIGVWVQDEKTGAEAKIAALGVRITRWVSWHGVSLNVNPDLSAFSGIVPCGIREHGVTSLHALGVTADMAEVDAVLVEEWLRLNEATPSA